MKIAILDAGLDQRGGHHFDFVHKLSVELSRLGYAIHIYGYVGMEADVEAALSRHAKVTKLLRPFHYDDPAQVDAYAGDLLQFQAHSAMLAEDLRAVDEADLWIWPSLTAHQLYACVLCNVTAPIVGSIHHDPGIEARTPEAMLWRMTLVLAHERDLRLTLGSVESELRHRFMQILVDGRFQVFPQPFDGAPPNTPRTTLRRIGFFGSHRPEKGARRTVVPLLNRLVADGYDVLFHNSNNHYAEHDLPPGVEVLHYVEDLAEPISRCDLVVLPYVVDQYRIKGSGILAMCMAQGVPVAGPFGTIPGRVIEEHGAGPLFPRTTIAAIHATVKYADANYPAFAAAALRSARRFAARNGIARHAQAMLAAAAAP
jgi:hypothetical protein